jgi:hypothetical protein
VTFLELFDAGVEPQGRSHVLWPIVVTRIALQVSSCDEGGSRGKPLDTLQLSGDFVLIAGLRVRGSKARVVEGVD